MKHPQYDDDEEDLDENGVIRDGTVIRVPLHMADAVQKSVATSDFSFADADERQMADAHSRSVSSLNEWRGGAPAHQPQTNHGTFAPMQRDRLTTTDTIDRAEAAADAAYDRSVARLNEGRPQHSRASDAAEAMLMADEAYNKSVNDLNAWRNR